jgi:hypothetical protein
MSANDLRKEIESALHRLATAPLREGATDLLHTLGYQSDRTMPWTLETFLERGRDAAKPLTGKDIQDLQQLKSLHLLF